MAIDLARVQALPKPWGVANLPPWNRAEEMGQRSEIAFGRLDLPRKRDLHNVAIAIAGAAEFWLKPKRLTDAPTLLLSSRRYAHERIERAPGSEFHLEANLETSLSAAAVAVWGDAVHAQSEGLNIEAGLDGMTSLAAYKSVGNPAPYPPHRPTLSSASDAAAPEEMRTPRSPPQTKATPVHAHAGTMQ
jgi:hypothetical protein